MKSIDIIINLQAFTYISGNFRIKFPENLQTYYRAMINIDTAIKMCRKSASRQDQKEPQCSVPIVHVRVNLFQVST